MPGTSPEPEDNPLNRRRPNRLIQEKSPYLLQHANNPVDWYPWGDEAFSRARNEDRPVFLSIGYATCHWCHVMAQESFDNAAVAALLNRYFVCIKVDREEHPDIDNVYMAVCQMMTGQGGWPLTIIMTPDKKPFFAATYLPPTSRFGLEGLLDLLPRIERLWREQRDALSQSAENIASAIRSLQPESPGIRTPDDGMMDAAFDHLLLQFDPKNGGFGTAPKFPSPHILVFLTRYWYRTRKDRALEIAKKTICAIRNGGIYDQIGFGLHRYSTDAQWRVPHFEKMLYDQALMVIACTEIYLVTKEPFFCRMAREIITYVLRDMTSPEGAFFSAEDADSEGGEGAYYTWTWEQLETALGPEKAARAAKAFTILPVGNYPGDGDRAKRNIPRRSSDGPEAMQGPDPDADTDALRERLFAMRVKRPRPAKDDKVLADWNALFCIGLAQAARAFGDPAYADAARRALMFILTKMRSPDGGLYHRYRDGEPGIPGFADDYAFTVRALIALYEVTYDVQLLSDAIALNRYFTEHFWDPREGGFFSVSDRAEAVIARRKEWYDGAVPSSNSVACENLLLLSRLTGDIDLEELAAVLSRWFLKVMHNAPASCAWFLVALDLALGPSHEVVIAGDPGDKRTVAMIRALQAAYLPRTVILQRPLGTAGDPVVTIAPFTRELVAMEGMTTAYVCSGHICRLPLTEIAAVLSELDAGIE